MLFSLLHYLHFQNFLFYSVSLYFEQDKLFHGSRTRETEIFATGIYNKYIFIPFSEWADTSQFLAQYVHVTHEATLD